MLFAQDIEVGPIRVDTGHDWTDFGMVVMLIVIVAFVYVVVKRALR